MSDDLVIEVCHDLDHRVLRVTEQVLVVATDNDL